MDLLSLGHSAYLLEIDSPHAGRTVRILADPWLSDHVIGDLMGRFPRVRIDFARLAPIDAVFLSHSHTDHCDPYSLVQLWRELDPRPVLLLPQSLEHLAGLFREFLAGVEILRLRESAVEMFHGVELSAFFNPETRATNEDDVMVLVVANGSELFLSESDALLPFYDPQTRERLAELLAKSGADTIAFLTTKNETEATMAMLGARDPVDRRARLSRCLERTYAEVEEIYTPVDDLDADIWQNDRLVRLVGGQGICFPQHLATPWNRVLFPIQRRDRVRMEQEIAAQVGCAHSIAEFVPGEIHVVRGGRLERRTACKHVRLLDREEDRSFTADLEVVDDFPVAPLRDERRDAAEQELRILAALNHRFRPWWIGARSPPIEHLLAAGGGEYRVRVRFGTRALHHDVDYRFGFDRREFHACVPLGDPDEFYWANDVDDVLAGLADEFSLFCRKPLGGTSQRFWCSLGMPYLNDDLVERKLRFHFERAARGESLEEWVLAFYR